MFKPNRCTSIDSPPASIPASTASLSSGYGAACLSEDIILTGRILRKARVEADDTTDIFKRQRRDPERLRRHEPHDALTAGRGGEGPDVTVVVGNRLVMDRAGKKVGGEMERMVDGEKENQTRTPGSGPTSRC